MLLYYAALLCILLRKISLRNKRLIVVTACSFILILPILLTWRASHHPDQTRITILAVGAGSCAIIETDAGQTLLFDAGSTGTPDLYRNIIEPFLRTRHLRRIDAAYISHADFDHYGAIPDIATHIGITHTYLTPQFRRDAADTPAAAAMLRTLDTLHTPAESLSAPRAIRLSDDTTLDILWPPPDAMDLSTNDSGLVIRLTVAGRTLLFPADIQDTAMQALLTNPDSLHADILLAPHHGSFEKSTPDFISAVSPVAIISSDDNTPSGKQRTFDETFADLHPLHTHESGAITISIDSPAGTITITPFLPAPLP
jgi:competence protein ComEC